MGGEIWSDLTVSHWGNSAIVILTPPLFHFLCGKGRLFSQLHVRLRFPPQDVGHNQGSHTHETAFYNDADLWSAL